MITAVIQELIQYGLTHNLISEDDRVYTTNRLLELLEITEFTPGSSDVPVRALHEILEDILDYAIAQNLLDDDTITTKDLFDTKVMGLLTPPPSYVRKTFQEKYNHFPQEATDYYYQFSQATNYIRKDRIAKDVKWVTDTDYGPIDITINLSKPEKDPRDIAKAGAAKKSGYPSCLLCRENEGYAGHVTHPARQNHRIIPITLMGEDYFLQYSPYVYYNEHCIILNKEHIPMTINQSTFEKLLDFVKQFPHYTAGSNADLPIVGGSILSHDHFQGGRYDFAMAKASYESTFSLKGFPSVTAGIVKWPMSIIRLQGEDADAIAEAGNHILQTWRGYTDEAAYIFSETDGTPHNTITPIVRMKNGLFELDLVLRNNITTNECPLGLYHPHTKYHHLKKENIGLIEVMGLAILPARLKADIGELADAIVNHRNIHEIPSIANHADWVDEWIDKYSITADNVHAILQAEIGKTFAEILECAGVYKRTPEGKAAFERFINTL